MDDQLEISETNKEKNQIIVNRKYKFNLWYITNNTKRIPLYHRIVHPLFASTLCKEITYICPVCNKYNKLNNKKSVCCKKRIIPASFSLHKKSVANSSEYSNVLNIKQLKNVNLTLF